MKNWLSVLFTGLPKPKSHEIENLRQGLLRIEDNKKKPGAAPELDSLVVEMLEERNWALSADNNNMARALDILRFQCELPLNFKICVEDYSRKSHEFQESMAFIMDHKEDIFDVAEALKDHFSLDLEEKPKIIIHDKRLQNHTPEVL